MTQIDVIVHEDAVGLSFGNKESCFIDQTRSPENARALADFMGDTQFGRDLRKAADLAERMN